jgi:hypothetical protein
MEPLRQNIDSRGAIPPDRDLMAIQLLETLQGSECVMVVVQDCYFHSFFSIQDHPPETIKQLLFPIVSINAGQNFLAQVTKQPLAPNIQSLQV